MGGYISFLIVLLLGALIWSPNGLLNFNSKDDLANIAVEFHGMIFDVILFGIILTLYEYYSDNKKKKEDKINAKNLRIERYKEELEDYKGWTDNEAAFRVAGIVKRLLNEGVKDIDLSKLHLGQLVQIVGEKGKELIENHLRERKALGSMQGANLVGANLQGTNLSGANLQGANLSRANLKGADLVGANLKGADLSGANLQGTSLWGANLQGENLTVANLQGAKLWSANLQGTNLWGANLQGANLSRANLQGAYLRGAKLHGANLWGTNLQGVVAIEHQRDYFGKVMTEEQLNSIEWGKNPYWYKPEKETTDQVQTEKPKCTAKTKKGNPCKNSAKDGHDKCHIHLKS